MTGLTQVVVGCEGRLTLSGFYTNRLDLCRRSRSIPTSFPSSSTIRRVRSDISSQLSSSAASILRRIPGTSYEIQPSFTYQKIAHQSKAVRPGRFSSVIRRVSSSSDHGAEKSWSASRAELEVFSVAAATAILATANKILYKMALVPMKEYPFFLAQLNTFGYVVVYFTILYGRYRAGIVTDDMLGMPKGQFVAVGALEALGLATGMAAAAVLPAASIPVLLQVYLVWQLMLSAFFLGKKYTKGQIAGCLLVVTGVIIVVASGGRPDSLQHTGIFWPVLMIISALFSAAGSILKEAVFKNAERDVKGGNVDIFVVNSFGSGFQALFVLLLLPLLSNFRGIPFHQLGSYFKDGSACFFNVGAPVGCDGSPLVPLLYVVANMAFNISALYLMKISSAILSSLCTTLSVPLAIFAFTLPLPYLGVPPPLHPKLFLGSAVLVIGLALYNLSNPKMQSKLE